MHELSSIFDDSNKILYYFTANTFENTYLRVINFYFGYDGYCAEKTIPPGYRLVRPLNEMDETFQMPCSGQKEIFDTNGNVIKFNAALAKSSFGSMDDYISYEKPKKIPPTLSTRLWNMSSS